MIRFSDVPDIVKGEEGATVASDGSPVIDTDTEPAKPF